MTEIEKKALALVNEMLAENYDAPCHNLPTRVNSEALCRAIEAHEATEAALRTLVNEHEVLGFVGGPSAEAWDAARAALAARGLEIVEKK